jgi:hypothetical protein
MEGADLYLDDGTYYYSETPAGLPAVVAAHETTDGGWMARLLSAAVAATTLDIADARTRMANAAFDPAHPPQALDPGAAAGDEAAALNAKRTKLEKAAGRTRTPSPGTHEDAMIWTNSLDALVGGGSRPAVRAGVLRLLATIPQVAVSQVTVAGRPALELDAGLFPDRYEERLTIDAESGMPLRFVGTVPGETPGVVMTYQVTRVDSHHLAG